MSRFLISLVTLGAVATLAFGPTAAIACPRDGKDAKADVDYPCKRHHKSAQAMKKASKAPAKSEAAAPAAPQKQTMRDLSPAPHVRMLDSLSQPAQLKVPEQARLDASVGVFI